MQADATLIKKTDQCVMCGLCLPHCPTYRVSQHEAESPRGRISLIKALAQNQLQASPAIQTHLQSCTGCMRCQEVCPANVPYHEIIDVGRSLYQPKLDFSMRCLHYSLVTLLSRTWGHKLFSLLQTMARGIYNLGLFRHNELIQLAQLHTRQKQYTSAAQLDSSKKNVFIFPGCTAQLLDQETLNNTIKIVNTLGFQAKTPKNLICCSALAQHSGLTELAQQQRHYCKENLYIEQSSEIISFASGCGQQLDENFANSSKCHLDIHAWLNNEDRLQQLILRPLEKRVLVHTPCSMQTNSHNVEAMFNVLKTIPDVTIQILANDQGCCGAGGMQLLTPQTSNQALLQYMLKTIQQYSPDIIVTANIGCALQLRKGLQQIKLKVEVMHPVTLLARQLVQ